MDAELEFAIQPNTTGKQLFDQVRTPFTIVRVLAPFFTRPRPLTMNVFIRNAQLVDGERRR